MKAKALLIGCLTAAVMATEAHGMVAVPVLSMNDFTGSISPTTDALAPTYTDTNVTASGIALGTGLTGVSTSGSYTAYGWPKASIGSTDYYTFTIGANTGYEIDYDTFVFNAQRTNPGPADLQLEYSIDGGAFQTIGPVIATTTGAGSYSIDLSALQNVTDSIEFRLYGYDAKNGNSGATFSLNSYSFNGTVSPDGSLSAVPEPQSLALIGVGSLLMFGYMKRKHTQNDTAV